VFEETNKLNEGDLVTDLFIPHPENVQFYHVQNIRDHLAGKVTIFKWSYGKSYRLGYG
jgi:hypothetical protein